MFKGMFGGLGIFHDGVMFGLVAYEQLYFKVDKEIEPRFAEAGQNHSSMKAKAGRSK